MSTTGNAPSLAPLAWQLGRVTAIKAETASARTLTLALPGWMPHLAGQHYDVRLVALDGYQAQRSYSVASAPERMGEIELTIERLDDGEVSTYLTDQLVVGDQVEVRGPIGGYFVWEVGMGGPLFLVAGGSGVVPLMAMLRHRAALGSRIPARLLYSVSSPSDVIYRQELEMLQKANDGLDVLYTYTRMTPAGWQGYARRIDRMMLADALRPLGPTALTYVCGPTQLVETAANALVELGLSPAHVRTERFGPTGKEQLP